MKRFGLFVVALFLAFSMCASAVEQATEAECKECAEKPNAVVKWGDNVVLTGALMKGQSLQDLLAGTVTVRDAVAAWNKNAPDIPASVNETRRKAAVEGLGELVALFAANPDIQWTLQDLYSIPWKELPGGDDFKKSAHGIFKTLKNKAKFMALTFVNRPPDTLVSAPAIAAMAGFVAIPELKGMDWTTLYNTPADPKIYDDKAFDLIGDVLDKYSILRDESPEVLVVDGSKEILCTALRGYCCDKKVGSPTYRTCVPGTVCCCTMVGSYCALASKSCPL